MAKPGGDNLAVGLLGPVVLFSDGTTSHSRSATLRTFLALVGLNAGRHVSSDAIADELWSDSLPKDPRAALHVIATRVRKWLESAGMPPASLRFDRDSYVLDVDPPLVDTTRFADAAVRGDGDALALWRGEPFGGCVTGPVLDIETGRLHELRLTLLETRCETLLTSGRHDVALVDAQALIREHPAREKVAALAMLALYREGRHRDALEVYQAHRRYVVEEYGLEPSKELAALEGRILDGDETLLNAGPLHVASRPRPSLHAPAPVTSFLGRADELARIDSALSQGARLVTITGPGGIGKTRLALEATRSLVDRFENGAWFVDLTPISDPSAIVAAIAATLDTQEPEDVLAAGPTLLVLDNLERLLSGVVAVSDLLTRCPELVVLATSRERLNVQGEHDIELAGLSTRDAAALFEVRALAANRPLPPDAPVDELCARVDGMPLAIELAAARLRTQSVAQLVKSLDAMLDVLAAGERDRPERHQALRAAIAESITGLTEPERSVFRACAVFAGGATGDAISEVCRPKFDEIAALVDKSLLRVDAHGRFVMLEPIRQYAEELLAIDEPGEHDERVAAHARYFLALAEEAEPHLVAARQHEWMDVLAEEHANLRLAWERGEGDTPVRIAACLTRWWAARDPSEGREVLARALVTCETESAVRAMALLGSAHLAILQGDLDAAPPALEQAIDLGDERATAIAHNLLGETARIGGNLDDAKAHYAQALAAAESLGDFRLVSLIRNNQGAVALMRGDVAEAAELLRASLAAAERIRDQLQVCRVLSNLGVLYRELGAHDDAVSALERCRDIARANEDRGLEANALVNLAEALHESGRESGAGLEDLAAAIEIYEELGLRRALASALLKVPRLTNEVEHALEALARARSLFVELGDHRGTEQADAFREHVLSDL